MNRAGLALVVIVAVTGCNQPSYTFSGRTYTTDQPSSETVVLTGDPQAEPKECSPCPGVKVFLSRASGGEPIADQFAATSDENGNFAFTVSTKELGGKDVYFVVAKPGYEPYSQPITVGPLCPHLRTKILLKPVAKK